jgi:superoxide dismutase, Cu-Zn family
MTYRFLAAVAVAAAFGLAAGPALAVPPLHAQMMLATPNGPGAPVGTVTIINSYDGARITVDLHGLPPGQHGFHVHQNPSCAPGLVNGAMAPAGGAGPHFDPEHNDAHMGPMGFGHMGDLPFLTVGADGTDRETLTAPHIRDTFALKGRSLVIHVGGDNYADQPKPLGGGGGRLACGVIG